MVDPENGEHLNVPPAPTPAESPRAKSKKKKRAGMTDHEHLIDLDRALVKVFNQLESLERSSEQANTLLQRIATHLGLGDV